VYGWDTGEAAKGFAVALTLVVLAIGLCLVALRARLAKQ
jgi:hypothetical protein